MIREGEPRAKFQQKILKVVGQRRFNVAFHKLVRFRQVEEFQHVRVFDRVHGTSDRLALVSKLDTPSLSRLLSSRSNSRLLIWRSS